ncbi:MAG TPA: DUF3443 family protein, partial [Candidatus Angelobacter sp.]|nr:DUF3443 family protein [Candidatus Angelobacter sp.]
MSDLKLATLLCLVLCLVACGGSGSGGTNSGAGTPGASVSSVTVTCTPNTVLSGGTLNCSAAVVGTGTFWSTVTWTATVGTIGPTGVYTAPSVTTNTTATITATSEYDSTKVGTAAVAVTVPSTISGIQISCPPVPITTGQQTQCTADVMGPVPEDQSVTWSGTIGYPHTVDCQCVSASGVVTGPVVNGMDQVSLLAVSTVDPTKVGYGSVYVYSPGTVTSVTPSCTRTAIYPGQDSLCTAVVTGTGGYSSAVSWSSPGGQSWGEVTPSGLFVSSPNGSPTSYTATVIASAVQNSSVSGSVTIAVNAITKTPNNVAPLIVDGGPQVATSPYINAAFASVTVCTPGTSNCQTVDHVLVDTGSVGLRLLAAPAGGELTLPLPTYTEQSTGDDLVECAPFVSGYLWGPVATADFSTLADGTGEEAYAIPIQVVGESGQPAVPSTCSSSGADLSTLQALGANGILGVGVFSVD